MVNKILEGIKKGSRKIQTILVYHGMEARVLRKK